MIDLHCHSTASDGVLAPAAVVERAAALRLAGLALTDHDSLDGLEAARARAQSLGLRFLAGIELSTHHEGLSDVHLLGYGAMREPRDELWAACLQLRAARAERAGRMVRQLQAAGVRLELGMVEAYAGAAALARPHVARALIAGGWARDLADAFQRWLLPGAPGYVPHERLETQAAVRLLRRAGMAPVLAHPGRLGIGGERLAKLVSTLADERLDGGLAGIEAYWSRHTPEEVVACLELAARHDLLATGGSDFHGVPHSGEELGSCAGGKRLPLALMDKLENPASAFVAGSRAAQPAT